MLMRSTRCGDEVTQEGEVVGVDDEEEWEDDLKAFLEWLARPRRYTFRQKFVQVGNWTTLN